MKRTISPVLVLFIFFINLNAQHKYYDDVKILDANFIEIPIKAYGNVYYSRILTGENNIPYYRDGVYWNHYRADQIVFDQGLFFTGKINGKIHLAQSVWDPFFTPGPIFPDGPAMLTHPADSLKFRVYKISADDPSSVDLKEWPYEMGAPATNDKKPELYAGQTTWTVYNALDSNRYLAPAGSLSKCLVTPLEVHQLAYEYNLNKKDSSDYLNDVVFFEYQVINKGSSSIDSAVIGLWTDIDFYGSNEFPGVDTTLQLGYCWSNYTANGGYDSSKIPSVGYIMLYGPAVYSPGDTAIFKGKKKVNYKNLDLSSFYGVLDDAIPDWDDFGPAYSSGSAWNIAHGLTKAGRKIINPKTGKETAFKYPGDPVTNSGWLFDGKNTGGGSGFYMFSGTFTLAPKDTQWIMFALTAARGSNNLASVTELRKRAKYLRSFQYDKLVKTTALEYREPSAPAFPDVFELFQNYPNPFNNSTTIKYWLPGQKEVNLELFNTLGQKIQTIFRGEQSPGYHYIDFNAGNLATGIYFYRMKTDTYSSVRKLIFLK